MTIKIIHSFKSRGFGRATTRNMDYLSKSILHERLEPGKMSPLRIYVSHIDFQWVASVFSNRTCSWIVPRKTKPKKYNPDPACYTAPPRGKPSAMFGRFVAAIFLFVKWAADVVSRGFFCWEGTFLRWWLSLFFKTPPLTCVHAAYLYLTQQ